jgi:hypothetical protein
MTMTTITIEQQTAIATKLDGMILPRGLGDEHAACSIAAINLALSGRLTDEIPDCMSPVVGRWIIAAQDAMPDDMRNSQRWKNLLPLAAGTGREHEAERLNLIMDWLWGTVLPTAQLVAKVYGFGAEWCQMTNNHNVAAAKAAVHAAADAAAKVAWAVHAAAEAADVAENVAAEAWGLEVAEDIGMWDQYDPCALLERLVAVGERA